MTDPDPQPRLHRRGIYLLPNLFTTAALFAGFYAIVAGMDGRFEAAAAAIFVAMVLDGADGRIARMTNTQSAFGAEYDSLSDVICFGLAPGLIVYEWALSGMGKLISRGCRARPRARRWRGWSGSRTTTQCRPKPSRRSHSR